jgi:xanthine dehydrogenase YagT iron-sulfur-binding subunit
VNPSNEIQDFSLRVNGIEKTLRAEPRVSLLDALRDHLGLHGTKKGCDQGACGACTVLVDGERINSCLALAIQYEGREIVTIEGLAKSGQLHPMQQAFIDHDGFQCGYCTPGQICSAVGMLSEFRNQMPSAITDGEASELSDAELLTEETMFDDRTGRITNATLAEYHLPVQADVPHIEVMYTDVLDPLTPLGAHGIGEIGITGAAAAIANAIYHATGKRITSLPITLDKLLEGVT